METGQLSDKTIRAAKPDDRPYKLSDGRGMYLLIQPNGTKLWRLKYRIAGKERSLAIGVYPDVTLSMARDQRQAARTLIAAGQDPSTHKRMTRDGAREEARQSFASACERYFDRESGAWSETHRRDVRRIIDKELIPNLGKYPPVAIKRSHVEAMLTKIEDRGALTFAKDVRLYLRQVWKRVNAERGDRRLADPSEGVEIKAGPKVKHHKRLPTSEVGGFLRALQFSDALPMTRIAVRLLLLTGLRTNELRCGEWAEIDAKVKLWRIPETRMKNGHAHVVPLSRQALALLAELRTISGEGPLLFPNMVDPERPMSDMTILAAIYRLGYKGRMSGHGTRGMLSTWGNENGFNPDAIERQLSHVTASAVRKAYNEAEHLPERVRLMTAWADFLDAAERDADNVVPLHVAASAT